MQLHLHPKSGKIKVTLNNYSVKEKNFSLLNYPLPLKVTKKTTVTTEEKVFVDAGEYFDLTDKQFPHKISPVKPIRSVSTSTYLVDDDKRVLQKPAIKRTLLHRTARKSHSFCT